MRVDGRVGACRAHRVDLVNEDDTGRFGARRLEQRAHALRARAHEHLVEVGAGRLEEGHARLARHRLGQQRLATPWRTNEQDTCRFVMCILVIKARIEIHC